MRFVGIDPSTKTGFVALDENGRVLVAKELSGIGQYDPQRMLTMIQEIMEHVRSSDIVAVEGFPFSSPQAIQLGGIGWAIRMFLHRKDIIYYEVAPNVLKKRVGVTGFLDERDPVTNKKLRLKGPAKKTAVIEATERIFGTSFTNDNINDALVLAHIAKENYFNGVIAK